MQIALAGIGEVAVQQHLPAIQASAEWELVATCSRTGQIPGVPAFTSFEQMLATHPQIVAVSLCQPPKPRYSFAQIALQNNKHVMLEKPPGATVSECLSLQQLALQQHRSVFATWHSRQADMVNTAGEWLADKKLKHMHITWREDVRRWHAGQQWIWQEGGFGVLDPGINALSIVTSILPGTLYPLAADLIIPKNKHTPIAADIEFGYSSGATITANFDWREQGEQLWNIEAETDAGTLKLMNGGATLLINNNPVENTATYETLSSDNASNTLGNEYRQLYKRMAALVKTSECDMDIRPLQLVSDIFLIGRITRGDAFTDS